MAVGVFNLARGSFIFQWVDWIKSVPWSPAEGGKGVDGVNFFRIFVLSLVVCKYGCPAVIVV